MPLPLPSALQQSLCQALWMLTAAEGANNQLWSADSFAAVQMVNNDNLVRPLVAIVELRDQDTVSLNILPGSRIPSCQ
jgi:hypothetical protein